MRVSPDRDWKHLLEPYREHFQKTFGAVRYKADYRWIATDYLNHSQQADLAARTPTASTAGTGGSTRPRAPRQFCDLSSPALKEGGGQGVIVWGQGGDDPRGGMYRPDFDVLPPEVEAQLADAPAAFQGGGAEAGRLHAAARHGRAAGLEDRPDHRHQPPTIPATARCSGSASRT